MNPGHIKVNRRLNGVLFIPEALEHRRVLSAWATVDVEAAGLCVVTAMGADNSGNVYAAGYLDSPGLALKEKASGSANWNQIFSQTWGSFQAVATDSAGDVFLGGSGIGSDGRNGTWLIYERPAGKSTFAVIDDIPQGQCVGLATDAAGNVFAVGHYSVTTGSGKHKTTSNYGIVRKLKAGGTSFGTVFQGSNSSFQGATVVNSGGAAGDYVAGNDGSGNLICLKSSNGGSTWTQVDGYRLDSSYSMTPAGVVADFRGNLYVAGYGNTSTTSNVVVRESSDGGATWSIADNYQLAGSAALQAFAIGADPTGNIFVVGSYLGSSNIDHGIIRAKVGGNWSTSDDYAGPDGLGADYYAVTADSKGNLYVGGDGGDAGADWMIRSQPAAPTNLTAAADPTNPSSQIDLSWGSTAGINETGFAVYRSTNGVNFTQVATVGASTTAFSDTGLNAGTTYYYYVVSLLNSTGMSSASNQAAATTSV